MPLTGVHYGFQLEPAQHVALHQILHFQPSLCFKQNLYCSSKYPLLVLRLYIPVTPK